MNLPFERFFRLAPPGGSGLCCDEAGIALGGVALGVAIPLAPNDSFLGISSVANEADLAATEIEYARLIDQIRAIDPYFRDELEPLASMDWQGRALSERHNYMRPARLERARTSSTTWKR